MDLNKPSKFSDEHRLNISLSHQNPRVPRSEETKVKISVANKGRTLSEESRRNISLGHIGLRHSPESYKRQGEKMKGRTFSPEHRLKLSEAKKNANTDMTWNSSFGEERANLLRAGMSAKMKGNRNCPRRYCKRPSRPQIQLFNYLKTIWPELEIEYRVKCSDYVNYYLDIAYPSAMIDFEYDGVYFHQDKAKDMLRDERLGKAGWTVIRYVNEDLKSLLREG